MWFANIHANRIYKVRQCLYIRFLCHSPEAHTSKKLFIAARTFHVVYFRIMLTHIYLCSVCIENLCKFVSLGYVLVFSECLLKICCLFFVELGSFVLTLWWYQIQSSSSSHTSTSVSLLVQCGCFHSFDVKVCHRLCSFLSVCPSDFTALQYEYIYIYT